MNTSIEPLEYEIDTNSLDSTTSTVGLTLLAILPLIASPAIDGDLHLQKNHNDIFAGNYEFHYSHQIPATVLEANIGTGDNMIGSRYYENISESEISQLEIMEGFVSNILDNSSQQPSELNNMMFSNIESLLIGD